MRTSDVMQSYEAIMVWVPFSWLMLAFPCYVWLTHRKRKVFSNSSLSISKTILGISLMVLHSWILFYRIQCFIIKNCDNFTHLANPTVLLFTEALATFIVQYDRRHGIRVNGMLFFYRLLLEVLYIFILQDTISCILYEPTVEMQYSTSQKHNCTLNYSVVMTIALVLNTVLLFLTGCIAERIQHASFSKEKSSPGKSASCLSSLLFWWFSRFVFLARKKDINCDDIWELNDKHKCKNVSLKFDQNWILLQAKLSKIQQNNTVSEIQNDVGYLSKNEKKSKEFEELVPSFVEASEQKIFDGNARMASNSVSSGVMKFSHPTDLQVIKVLLSLVGDLFVVGTCLNIAHDILTFASPYIFKHLIVFIFDEEASFSSGILYVLLLFSCTCLQSILRNHYMMKYNLINIDIHSTLLSAIYKKSQLLSATRNDTSLGEIVNLMSVDVKNIVDMISSVNYLWSAPVQAGLAVYFLWQMLGASVLAGVVVIFLMMPINMWVAKKCKRFQVDQMNFKDARIKLMDELINAIKVIKLYAWEKIFQLKISKVREDELKVIRRAAHLSAVTTFAWASTPFLISLVTFGFYILSSPDNILTAEKAFVALMLFNILRGPLSLLPMFITNLVVAKVSLKRLKAFLMCEELKNSNPRIQSQLSAADSDAHLELFPSLSIHFNDATIAWKEENECNVILDDINLKISKNSLVAVVGCVGSGKSSLLSAIVGEVHPIKGECFVNGTVGYSSQQAWLQNTTIQDNILFGQDMEKEWYKEVLYSCALLPDMDMLPAADMTEVGEKGVTLSGGQKLRVNVARVVYSGADVCVFDDPFASVDGHVAKHLFEHVFSNSGLLKDKTRIVATNSISFLPMVDDIVFLQNGKISEVGKYKSLIHHKKDFYQFVQDHIDKSDLMFKKVETPRKFQQFSNQSSKLLNDPSCRTEFIFPNKSCFDLNVEKNSENYDNSCLLTSLSLTCAKSETFLTQILMGSVREMNSRGSVSGDNDDGRGLLVYGGNEKERGKLVEEEQLKTGRVNSRVLTSYLNSIGIPLCLLMFASYLTNNCLSISTNVWLCRWTDDHVLRNTSNKTYSMDAVAINTTAAEDISRYRVEVYAALGLLYGLTLLFRSFVTALACCRASRVLYSLLVDCLLSVPLSFYEKIPKGRIINRVSADVATLDYLMPFTISGFCNILILSTLTIALIITNIPAFIVPFLILLVFYVLLQRTFVITARQLRRLVSNSRSHVFSHLSESFQGVSTIRAFNVSTRFVDEMQKKIDDFQSINYANFVSQRWLGIWLELIGNVLVTMVALFIVIGRTKLSPGTVALSLTYAFDIIHNLNSLFSMFCELETNLVSIERIKEYSELDYEVDWFGEKILPPETWPSKGEIEFKEYSCSYRDEIDQVLKKMTFKINSNEKVGIVGRTGSGKTSILMSIFRILNADEGQILIDDIDISRVPLKLIRSLVTIVPQDPVILSGSVRFNLDPLGFCSDKELWSSLEEVGMKNHVLELPGCLGHVCSPSGCSLSLGQQQLLCLSRALLRKSRILTLDEATASVDVETEKRIKLVLQKKFSTKSFCNSDINSVENSHVCADQSFPEFKNAPVERRCHHRSEESCTLVAVAHRVNTVLNCDKVVVMEDGAIVECDTPQNLLGNPKSQFFKFACHSA